MLGARGVSDPQPCSVFAMARLLHIGRRLTPLVARAGLQRRDSVRVQIGETIVPISWADALAVRRELVTLGHEKIERRFANVGTTIPVRISDADQGALMAAVLRVEWSPQLAAIGDLFD